MNRNILIVLTSLALILVVSSCGKNDDTDSDFTDCSEIRVSDEEAQQLDMTLTARILNPDDIQACNNYTEALEAVQIKYKEIIDCLERANDPVSPQLRMLFENSSRDLDELNCSN